MTQITVHLPDSIRQRADEQAFLQVLAKVPPGEPEEGWDKLPCDVPVP